MKSALHNVLDLPKSAYGVRDFGGTTSRAPLNPGSERTGFVPRLDQSQQIQALRLHLAETEALLRRTTRHSAEEILEANRRRECAERDSRTKDEFMAMLAHELRNPVNAIGCALSLLEVPQGARKPAERARAVIARQVGYISHLVNDLLDVERLTSGRLQLDRQPIDLAVVVRRAVATFTDDPRMNRRIEITTEPVWIDGDAVRIEQVVINIMANAVKYSLPGGRIQITLSADGHDAVFKVEDAGAGIASTLLPVIFDLYRQDGRTLGLAQGGLGIGLSIVRRLVELHGGTIAASSPGEGLGSVFTVRLRRIAPVLLSTPPPCQHARVAAREGRAHAEHLRERVHRRTDRYGPCGRERPFAPGE